MIDDALDRARGTAERPDERITVDLPFLQRGGLAGRMVGWRPMRGLTELVRDPVADIAVLGLAVEAEIPDGVTPERVDRRTPLAGAQFLTYGFPEGFDNGTQASGEILVRDAGGWLQVRDTQDYGHFIKPGFSGAPVFAPAEQQLIGMVVAADSDAQTRLGFVLPAHLLCCAWPPFAQPYKGLFAFSEEDADLFFGRDGLVDELCAKLEDHSLRRWWARQAPASPRWC